MQIKPDSLISNVLSISFTMVLQFLLKLWNSPARLFEIVASSVMELCNSTAIKTLECEQSNYRGGLWIFQDVLWSSKPAPWPRQVWHRTQGFICGSPVSDVGPRLGAGIAQHVACWAVIPPSGCSPVPQGDFFPRILVKQAKAWCLTSVSGECASTWLSQVVKRVPLL